ncbi:hypothetical protein [Stenomitos frigidus]|jgi:hypothetical protein
MSQNHSSSKPLQGANGSSSQRLPLKGKQLLANAPTLTALKAC